MLMTALDAIAPCALLLAAHARIAALTAMAPVLLLLRRGKGTADARRDAAPYPTSAAVATSERASAGSLLCSERGGARGRSWGVRGGGAKAWDGSTSRKSSPQRPAL